MQTSEKYVVIENCTMISDTMRAYIVECPQFPDKNGLGPGMLYVHKALMHPQMPVPVETGNLVVLKRFVVINEIKNYHELEEK